MAGTPTVTTEVSSSAGMLDGPPTATTRNRNWPGAPPLVSWLQVEEGGGMDAAGCSQSQQGTHATQESRQWHSNACRHQAAPPHHMVPACQAAGHAPQGQRQGGGVVDGAWRRVCCGHQALLVSHSAAILVVHVHLVGQGRGVGHRVGAQHAQLNLVSVANGRNHGGLVAQLCSGHAGQARLEPQAGLTGMHTVPLLTVTSHKRVHTPMQRTPRSMTGLLGSHSPTVASA